MKLGVIGGSGLYELENLKNVSEKQVITPFGKPSDAYIHGTLNGREVYFLPRHGRGHRLLPSEINHRANIMGFKMLGVDRILSVSAVGSLKAKLRPRDIVFPDQYFDRTKNSSNHTFFGDGLVAHVPFGDPVCAELAAHAAKAAKKVVARKHLKNRVFTAGTYVNMEGPAFSTRAESNTYRKMGFDIIGMTSLPEAKLCREAEICYAAMSMVTDYDCWHMSEEDVSVEMVMGHFFANRDLAKEIIVEIVSGLSGMSSCACHDALKGGFMTAKDMIPSKTRKRLAPIVGRYLK